MQAFWITVQIVLGILSPILLIIFLIFCAYIAKGTGPALQIKLEEIKKQPPFDEVEVNVSPATNVMTARFIKKGVIIWQGASSRNRMERDGILEFTSEEIKS